MAMDDLTVLAFDASSSLAQYRKNYTTTSALTFSIPPPSALRGLVGAVLGLRASEYSKMLRDMRFGIRVMDKISKTRIMMNYVNTKFGVAPLGDAGSPRIQVRVEFVRNPRYRIYVTMSNETLMSQLTNMLKEHRTVYTPYLGVASCIAHLSWVGEWTARPVEAHEYRVVTAVPRDRVKRMQIEPKSRYIFERVPLRIDSTRTPEEYIDLVFDADGGPVVAEIEGEVYEAGGDQIVLV